MAGEGFKLAVLLVISFMLLSVTSLYAVAKAMVDVGTLKELYTGLASLAATLGINSIIIAYVVTRNQGKALEGTKGMDSTMTTTSTSTTPPEKVEA